MKIRFICLTFIFSLLILTGCEETAAPPEPSSEPEIAETINCLFKKSGVAGLSVAVIRDGELKYTVNKGLADVANSRPVTDETLFEAASLSKVVFAYICMKLIDAEVLQLDRPLLEYVSQETLEKDFFREPLSDERFKQITLRMVLSHRTGLPNWRFFDGPDSPLRFRVEPDTRFGYSGEGFQLAQKVVELITQKSLQQLAEEYVFEPLAMNDSQYTLPANYQETLAIPTDLLGESTANKDPEQFKPMAAASLLTTAPDYARFLIALGTGAGISAETKEMMLTPESEIAQENRTTVYWGLGVGLTSNSEDAALWHWGDNGNAKSFFYMEPSTGNGFVYFSNDRLGLGIFPDLIEAIGSADDMIKNSALMVNYVNHTAPSFETFVRYRKGGVDQVSEYQTTLFIQGGDKAYLPEQAVNVLGYRLLAKERYAEAIAMLEMNTYNHPDSANVWDSLAEAHLRAGQIDKARELYEKALSIDPNFQNAIDAIEQIDSANE
jgi:CubicO group peptidase (beta-lactamase class C family)